MAKKDFRGRRERCRSWEEVKFVNGVSQSDLAKEMNKLAREGWMVYEPQCEQSEDEGDWNMHNKTYTIKATRDWCICGLDEEDQ